jgi:hypothetical protein
MGRRRKKIKRGKKGDLHSKNGRRIYDEENMYKRYTKEKANEGNMETKMNWEKKTVAFIILWSNEFKI